MNIAIIIARKGSQRIKNKNIKKFMGKPIIKFAIDNAKKSKIFDQIIVSTDSKKIANISKKYGADIPFVREKKYSTNNVSTLNVIRNAIKNLKLNKKDYVCCIYPCTPLLTPKDIINGKNILKKNNFSLCVSTFASSVYNSFIYNKKNKKVKKNFKNKFLKKNDKNLIFFDCGYFYWGKVKSWIEIKDIFNSKISLVKIPRWRAQDINYMEDWKFAEKLKIINSSAKN